MNVTIRSAGLVVLLSLLAAGCASTHSSKIPRDATLFANDSRYASIRGSELFGKVQVLTFFTPTDEGRHERRRERLRQALLSSERLHRAYLHRQDVEVKAIAVSATLDVHSEDRLGHDLARWGITVPVYWDNDAVIAAALGTLWSTRQRYDHNIIEPFDPIRNFRMGPVGGWPITIVLDREGKEIYRGRASAASTLEDQRLMQAVLQASQ